MLIHFMDKETEAKNLKNTAQVTQLVHSRVGAQTKVFVSLSSLSIVIPVLLSTHDLWP